MYVYKCMSVQGISVGIYLQTQVFPPRNYGINCPGGLPPCPSIHHIFPSSGCYECLKICCALYGSLTVCDASSSSTRLRSGSSEMHSVWPATSGGWCSFNKRRSQKSGDQLSTTGRRSGRMGPITTATTTTWGSPPPPPVPRWMRPLAARWVGLPCCLHAIEMVD